MLYVFVFILGGLIGFGTGFFVYHNNQEKANQIAEEVKEKVEDVANTANAEQKNNA